uniref:Uncharacterized protein n=1 Tax=Romanomermis culicivorax TaxID=13658 RepID=A0A915J8Z3_ROMCU
MSFFKSLLAQRSATEPSSESMLKNQVTSSHDEDCYKSEGTLTFVVNNLSKLSQSLLSCPTMIRGLPW